MNGWIANFRQNFRKCSALSKILLLQYTRCAINKREFFYKNYSITVKKEHFKEVVEWWNNKKEITIDGFDKAKKYSIQEIQERNYNLDLCGYPYEEKEILPPMELLQKYQEKRAELDKNIDDILNQIKVMIGVDING